MREDCVTVGVLDLTGSAHGRWSEPTAPGGAARVRARLLLHAPERWHAAVATLGRAGDRFVAAPVTAAEHREGRAVEVEVPIEAGWSVLRLARS